MAENGNTENCYHYACSGRNNRKNNGNDIYANKDGAQNDQRQAMFVIITGEIAIVVLMLAQSTDNFTNMDAAAITNRNQLLSN